MYAAAFHTLFSMLLHDPAPWHTAVSVKSAQKPKI